MLKKLIAPVLFTSILVVAGCSSDEASKDLENADDVEINEGDQKEEGTSKDSKQDTQGSDDQSSKEKDSSADSSENSSEQEKQDSTKEQSNDTSKEEDQATEQQGSETSSSGSGGGSGQDTSDTSESNETSKEKTYTFNEVNGEAVNVIQGINAVEIKRQNLNGAKATSAVAIKAAGKQINLSYNKERDSFRNYQIKDVELEQLKQATVIIQG